MQRLRALLLLFLTLFGILWSAQAKDIVTIEEFSESKDDVGIELCAQLSDYVSEINTQRLKPFVRIKPSQSFGLTLEGRDLCISGLKPRTRYEVIINHEIPLGEYQLDKDYAFTKVTTDYPPSIRFKDDGYILPSKGDISIPIVSMNVKKIALDLYRINTRNLIHKINEYGLIGAIYDYDLDQIASTDGYFLWQKRVNLEPITPNQKKISAIDVGRFLKKREPGVYILRARMINDDGEIVEEYEAPIQWFMISDIGLYTLWGTDGLKVYTRHLSNAQAYKGVRLELVAKNNEILGRAVVSEDGSALFKPELLRGKRGLKPQAIYAYGENGDFCALILSRPPLDLSDRGVGGRTNPGRYDAYIYSNRGIFRPGEEVPIEILLRDRLIRAQAGVRLSMKLYDSRGAEVQKRLLVSDDLGHISLKIPIPPSAATGRWRLKLYAGDEKPIATFPFLVEDFVPPKIKIDIEHAPKMLQANVEEHIGLIVKYLNGLPLKNGTIEAEILLHVSKEPFNGYEGYHFGSCTEEFENRYLDPIKIPSDIDGKADIPIKLTHLPESTLPLAANIAISAYEAGGRPVKKILDILINDKPAYIGIKPDFEMDSVDPNLHPRFKIAYIKAGKASEGVLQYRLIQEEVHWQWESDDNGWSYKKTYSDGAEILKGVIQMDSKASKTLTLPKLSWGDYRLEVIDSNHNEILSSYRFSSGYGIKSSKASPDLLPIAIDRKKYRVNDKLWVHITPKFSGPIIVSIANDKILETKSVEANRSKSVDLSFEVKPEWGSSVYVLATAFRAQSKNLGANRAVGVAHFAVEYPKKIIDISMRHPKRAHSQEILSVHISAPKAAGKKTLFTLAAVDEGVLRLTDFKAPDPVNYFFGKRRLGIEIRDVYGELIKASGAHARFEVGAGDENPMPAQEPPVVNRRKVLALFHGPLSFDQNGEATVKLKIPDYQGAVRLMAVAWSANAIGAAKSEAVIRDNVSIEIYMPRFLSVGDDAKGMISIDFDPKAGAGEYEITFENSNIFGPISRQDFRYSYDADGIKRFSAPIHISAPVQEDLSLKVTVKKGGALVAKRRWQLAVRSRFPEISVRKIGILPKGAFLDPKSLFDPSRWERARDFRFKLSNRPLFASYTLAKGLVEYPLSCAEQSTSRAMPWLFAPSNSALAKRFHADLLIQKAINRLINMQKIDGGFSLWGGAKAEMWLSAYVMDFLSRAKKAGYAISDLNIKSGLKWIETHLDRWSKSSQKQEADAYGLYVLARNGHPLVAEILARLNDPKSPIISAEAWAHLGAALAYLGDTKHAQASFNRAFDALGAQQSLDYYSNYGGLLRDETALLLLMRESGINRDWERRLVDIAQSAASRKWLSTQEMSQLLRLSFTIPKSSSVLKLRDASGAPLSVKGGEYSVNADSLSKVPKIQNIGDGVCWYHLSFMGTPSPQGGAYIKSDGFTIQKHFYTLSGKEIDPSEIMQNSKLVVVIEGKIQNDRIRAPLITDWIPAGFELENPHLGGVDILSGLRWLDDLSETEHEAYRNDRFIAALKRGSLGSYRVAYIIQAVTEGNYTLPPAQIEDMYLPYLRALTPLRSKKIHILKRVKSPKVSKSASASQSLKAGDFDIVWSIPVRVLSRYSIQDLYILRNSIFARAGLDFSRIKPELHSLFSKYAWYHPFTAYSGVVYKILNQTQRSNVQRLLAEEKRRSGGLVLADFERLHTRLLRPSELAQFSKEQLAILRNSLYARYGYIFHKKRYQKIFSAMPWYHPTGLDQTTIYNQKMSEIEKENLRLILQMEKKKRAYKMR